MWRTYREIWALFDRRGRVRLLALCSLMLVAALIEAVAVLSVAPFVSGLVDGVALKPDAGMAGSAAGLDEVASQALFFGVVMLLAVALRAVADYAVVAFSCAQSARWAHRLLRVHLNKEYDWFLIQHSGNIGYGLLSRVQEVVNGSLQPALRLVVNACVALCILVVLMHSAPMLILVVATGLAAVYSGLFFLLRRRFIAIGTEKEVIGSLRFRLVGELFAGIKEIKLHGLEAGYDDDIRKPFQRYATLQARRHLYGTLPRYTLEALAVLAFALAVLVLAMRGERLQEAFPMFGLFAFAALRILPAVQQVYGNAVQLPIGLRELSLLQADIAGGDDAMRTRPVTITMHQALHLDRVSYTYPGAERPSIDDLDLRIEAGSMVALVGQSGSGKSTIADFSMGLLEPARGALRIDGMTLDREQRRDWQASCAYVAQHVFLIDDSIAANIAFGLSEAQRDQEKIESAARAASLHDFIITLPAGYATRVGERGVRLSGGQRQRIGIARALYRDARFLVLDEATNALDPATEAEVLTALENLRGRCTILVIAHRLSTVADCDRVLLIGEGRLLEDGSYAELTRNSPHFRRFANIGDDEVKLALRAS